VTHIENEIHNEKLDFRAWYFRERGWRNGRGATLNHMVRKERLKRRRRLILYRITLSQILTRDDIAKVERLFVERLPVKKCFGHG
jgi:hypothetical protein